MSALSWSIVTSLFQYLVKCLLIAGSEAVRPGDVFTENFALQLLLGFKNLLIVLSSSKVPLLLKSSQIILRFLSCWKFTWFYRLISSQCGVPFQDLVSSDVKGRLLNVLLDCLASQIEVDDATEVNIRLASICSAAFLTLLKKWRA